MGIETTTETRNDSRWRRPTWILFCVIIIFKYSYLTLHNRILYSHSAQFVEASTQTSGPVGEIMRDVRRTFPNHSFFIHDGPGEKMLSKVLIAISIYNPEVGYCQVCSLVFVSGSNMRWYDMLTVLNVIGDEFHCGGLDSCTNEFRWI